MTDPRPLTAPQRRALEWLPRDGAWAIKLGRMSPAVDSLLLYRPDLAEQKWGLFGPRNGWRRRVRLTAAGVAAVAALSTERTDA